jgi:PAS domain-containing protein
MGIEHYKLVNQALAVLARHDIDVSDVIALGENLVNYGADNLSNGGFWIMDLNSDVEFYSPNFRKSLGFKGEEDFPNVSLSWQQQIEQSCLDHALKEFNKAYADLDYQYYTPVSYRKKEGGIVDLLCSGTFIKNKKGEIAIMVGSHIIDS